MIPSPSLHPATPTRSVRSCARGLPTGLVLGVLALLASTVLGGVAAAQAPGTPFPGPLVAPVVSGEVEPELDIRGIVLVDGADASNPVIGVGFTTAFEQPTSDYRVSVLAGNPAGPRQRASYVAGAATGSVEQSTDGETWTPSGDTTAGVAPDGSVQITVPVGEQPDGALVWAEAQSGDDVVTTRAFSLDALVGRTVDGGLPSGSVAYVLDEDGGLGSETLELGPGPSLSIVNQGMSVTYPEPPPTELAGVAVTSVVDEIRLAPSYDGGAVRTDAVRIDRTNQSVELVDGLADPPATVDVAPDAWFIGGFPPDGAGVLSFDLGEIADSLGFQLSGDTVGAGIARTITLEDGRTATSPAVLGTLDWFDGLAGETTTTTAPAASEDDAGDDDDSTRQIMTIAAAVVAGVLALAGIALIFSAFRKRSGHRLLGEHADDRGVVDWTAEIEAVSVDDGPPGGRSEAPPWSEPPASAPVVEPEAARPAAVAPTLAEQDDGGEATDRSEAGPPAEPEPEHSSRRSRRAARKEARSAEERADDDPATGDEPAGDAAAGDDSVDDRPSASPAPSSASAPPAAADDPLAALNAQIGELSSRLGRLGEGDGSAE